MSGKTKGICPHCQRHTGDTGSPCPDPECSASRYAFIPILALDACKARASRKGGEIEPWIGRRVDRYLLIGMAGKGGMGAVYIALQQPLNREVALKMMPAIGQIDESLSRFKEEAQSVSALNHPNIVKLYDFGFGELDGQRLPYMALEYIKHGRTLKNLMNQEIAEHGCVRDDILIPVFEQLLSGLGAAHAVGIIHRDVKPENVMLTQIHGNQHFVKILDFGLATGLNSNNTGLEGSNQILGTPTYMAPEQIPGSKRSDIDLRTDIYAAGIMAFEAMCGTRPFPGDTALAVLTAKSNEKYNPFSIPAAAALTKARKTFLKKAIAFAPEARYQDSVEMLAALKVATASSGSKKRGGILGFMEDRLGGGRTDSETEPTPTPKPGPMYRPTPPGGAQNDRPGGLSSGVVHDPLAGTARNHRTHDRPAPVTSPGIRRPSGETTGPGPSGSSSWANTTNEIRRSGGAIKTMTAEQRALRLKGRRRRTTGQNMARAVKSERRSATQEDKKNLKKGVPAAAIFLGLVFILLASSIGIPKLIENKRQTRARADLKDLRIALTIGEKFVGLDSAMLFPGSRVDHHVNNPEKDRYPLLDPWKNPYKVRYSLQNPTGYILYSTGADGERDSCDHSPGNDDICVELGMP